MACRVVPLLALVLLAGCGEKQEPAVPRQAPVISELQQGGLVLVLRHATADAEISRQEKLSSCALQRNLTEAGREQSVQIGRAMRALSIPVDEVRASPMCRARDTARLAFGEAGVDRRLVSPGVIGDERDDRARARYLREAVEDSPAGGRNVVLVTHTGNIGAALGEETTQEGELLAYRDGELVGRVRPEEWRAHAPAAAAAP